MAVVEQGGETGHVQEVPMGKKAKYMRPGECQKYMRNTLAKEFEEIVAGFVTAAKEGSCTHLKLATELLKPVRRGTPRKKGPVVRYWEQLEKEQLERDRAEKVALGSIELGTKLGGYEG